MMPRSVVRLSAGRTQMTDELQTLCLHAGANSIFLGDKLLTTPNPGDDHDHLLLDRLGVTLATAPIAVRCARSLGVTITWRGWPWRDR